MVEINEEKNVCETLMRREDVCERWMKNEDVQYVSV
jgi:hypothetical protein